MTDPIPPLLGTYQHVHTSKTEGPVYSSSITIGTPSKGGEVKIYFDPADPVDAERRVKEAFRIRELARALAEGAA